ncbi:DUF1697 domain-containing protein [Glaciihabitans arcticus]|uniref:DUF1697 domain-containing protein n=1 Tax=Glaciihabitans arcticus TaxID=2668039 RepID=A0A4Q9GTK8_9MICO|nr:DUF1697 domain-containing protein [Glaciihabitans arcticus]TBN55560.1 DUF1697 domain-containing protein [Glaciihabitans arcticus]
MTRRAFLLRAVNVGGTAKLPTAELRALAEELGARDVATYIASGNLLATAPAGFEKKLESAIEEKYGFFRDITSRTQAELEAALAAHPFEVDNPKYSYVTFLKEEPAQTAINKAQTFATGDDEWAVLGRDMHIRYANGAGTPSMKIDPIMRAIGTPGTGRNLTTVQKLIDLLAAAGE